MHERHIERAPAQVIDQHRALALAVSAVGQGRGGGFVQDTHHFEPSNLARVVRRLALRIREIGRHGDHRSGHRRAQGCLGPRLEGAQNHRRNFWRSVRLLSQSYALLRTHQALDRAHRAFGVEHVLIPRWRPYQQASVRGESYNGRHHLLAVAGQDLHLTIY